MISLLIFITLFIVSYTPLNINLTYYLPRYLEMYYPNWYYLICFILIVLVWTLLPKIVSFIIEDVNRSGKKFIFVLILFLFIFLPAI